MEKPSISIFASAIRTQHWLELYEMLSADCIVSFEIVFAGHVKPDFALPENFIHIYNNNKAPHCIETAYRNTKGDYVMFFADDLVPNPGYMNEMWAYTQRMWNDKAILYARFNPEYDHNARDGAGLPPLDSCMIGQPNNPLAPVVGAGFTIRRSLWEELGGMDKRFTYMFGDFDFLLRVYEAGGHPFIVPTAILWERVHTQQRLSCRSGGGGDNIDANLFNKCWSLGNMFPDQKRALEVESFTADEISIVR